MKKLILGISLIVFAIYSCKKGIEYVNVSDISKQYCAFAFGSYWIVQNDATLETDSIFTERYEYGAIEEGEHDQVDKSTQTLSVTIRSSVDSVPALVYGTYMIGEKVCSFSMQNNKWYGRGNSFMFFTDKPALTRYPDSLNLYHHDQLMVNGILYQDVYEINDTLDIDTNFTGLQLVRANTFFVKKIGVIKNSYFYSDGTNETWSLLTYKVVIGE